MFGSAQEAKQAGWYSRRHETNEAHMASRITRRERQQQRREEAHDRALDRMARTDEEQLEILEQRGAGHCREVIRLRKKLGIK